MSAEKKRLMEKFLLRTQNICYYKQLFRLNVNRSYSLNPVCPNFFQISKYFKKLNFEFSWFNCIGTHALF